MKKELKTERITIRLTKEKHSYLAAQAKRKGQNISEYIDSHLDEPTINSKERAAQISQALTKLQNKINSLDDSISYILEKEIEELWQALN